MSNRQYDFTLAAVLGASQRIDAAGAKLKVLSSPAGPVGVKIDGGPELQLLEGQGFTMPAGKTFRDVVVRNLQAAANVGTIFIGEEGFEDTRITGTVNVIDGERNKVLGGVCFRGVSQYTGNLAAVELWNPVGSTKNIFVQAIRAGAPTADSWGIQTSDFQLASAGSTPSNLDRSGVASVALMRVGDSSTLTNPKGHGAGYIAASTDVIVVMPRPILLRPGFGCAFYLNSAANTLRATFEWEEWTV